MVGELSGWFQISDKNVGFAVNLGEAANQKGTPCNGKNKQTTTPKTTEKKEQRISRMVQLMVSHVFPILFRFPTLGLLHGKSAIRKAHVPWPGIEMLQQRGIHAIL